MTRTSPDFEDMLSGGDGRSLGRVGEAIGLVLGRSALFDGLFKCLFSDDEIVRMRASDALEKIARERPDLFNPYRKRLLTDVPKIVQPSVQWHLAQILAQVSLSAAERRQAIAILKANLRAYDDWIVTNLTLEALAGFAGDDTTLRGELIPILRRHLTDDRKAIAKRAGKLLAQIEADER